MAGPLTYWVELWRASRLNALVEDLTDILDGGGVSMNVDRAVKLEARFPLTDPDALDPYVDFLAPFVNIEYSDGRPAVRQQIGLYGVRVPPGQRSETWATAEYHGRDLTAELARQAFTDTYNIAQGTNVVTAVRTIITDAGFSRHAIVPTSQVLAGDRSFRMGTTKLEACNQLLASIGYYHLYTTGDGKLASQPSRAVQFVEPVLTLTGDDVEGEVETQPLDTTVANVVIVVKDDPAATPLEAVRRNDDLLSPTSTVNIGETVRFESLPDAVDQAAVDAYAERLLSEGRSFYQTAQATIMPNPAVILPHQTVNLALAGEQAILNGLWWLRTAEFGFRAQESKPKIEINRVTDQIKGAII